MRSITAPRLRRVFRAVVPAATVALAMICPIPQSPTQIPNRERIAEGEYKVYKHSNDGGTGPFVPAIYNFTETWTLWRLPNGTFEAEGERNYDSPSDESHSNRFVVRLGSGLRVLEVTEHRRLLWVPDSGPLSCIFNPGKMTCTSNAKDPAKDVSLSIPVEHPYGILWPISAFSLGSITRSSERKPERPLLVEMVVLDEPNLKAPAMASVLEGSLRYLNQENITVDHQKLAADRYELKVALHPPFIIWASPQGLLLDFAEEDNQGHLTEDGMRLIHYHQWADF